MCLQTKSAKEINDIPSKRHGLELHQGMNFKNRKIHFFRNSNFIYHSYSAGLFNKQSCMFVFEVLTVHGGMRASIPWMHRGVKIRRWGRDLAQHRSKCLTCSFNVPSCLKARLLTYPHMHSHIVTCPHTRTCTTL